MNTRIHAFRCVVAFALAGLSPLAVPPNEEPYLAGAAPWMAAEAAASPTTLKVVLLKPSIVFQQVGGYTPKIPGDNVNGAVLVADQLVPIASYQNVLLDAARKALGTKVALVDKDQLARGIVEECNKLERLGSGLAAGEVNGEAPESLASLGAIDDQYAVLVQFFVVTLVPFPIDSPYLSGDLSAYPGSSSLPSASALLQASVISAKTGKVIWKGQQLLRNKNRPLWPKDIARSKGLRALYRDFDLK